MNPDWSKIPKPDNRVELVKLTEAVWNRINKVKK